MDSPSEKVELTENMAKNYPLLRYYYSMKNSTAVMNNILDFPIMGYIPDS